METECCISKIFQVSVNCLTFALKGTAKCGSSSVLLSLSRVNHRLMAVAVSALWQDTVDDAGLQACPTYLSCRIISQHSYSLQEVFHNLCKQMTELGDVASCSVF